MKAFLEFSIGTKNIKIVETNNSEKPYRWVETKKQMIRDDIKGNNKRPTFNEVKEISRTCNTVLGRCMEK